MSMPTTRELSDIYRTTFNQSREEQINQQQDEAFAAVRDAVLDGLIVEADRRQEALANYPVSMISKATHWELTYQWLRSMKGTP